MSEQQAEKALAAEEVIIPDLSGDSAFGTLMDTLAPEAEGAPGEATTEEAGKAAPAAGGADGADGKPAAGDDGKPAAGDGATATGTGGDGKPADGATDAGAGAGGTDAGSASSDAGGIGTVDAAELAADFGNLSTSYEENIAKGYTEQHLEAVKTEHASYFDALEQHPRTLVGKQVPSMDPDAPEGSMETLRDEADVKSWQEAVKQLLVKEIQGRVSVSLDENSDALSVVHSSIELFQKNADLIPGTKQFDKDLADRFASYAEPYELRVEGKLNGWSIPTQPLIEKLRKEIARERSDKAAADAAAGKPAAQTKADDKPAEQQTTTEEKPQAGIQSKAGATDDGKEGFATLFSTIDPSLANMRI